MMISPIKTKWRHTKRVWMVTTTLPFACSQLPPLVNLTFENRRGVEDCHKMVVQEESKIFISTVRGWQYSARNVKRNRNESCLVQGKRYTPWSELQTSATQDGPGRQRRSSTTATLRTNVPYMLWTLPSSQFRNSYENEHERRESDDYIRAENMGWRWMNL
jgi:hypothetical protein